MFWVYFCKEAKTMSSRVAQAEMSTKLALWKMKVWKRWSLQEPVGRGGRGSGIGVHEDERGGHGPASSSAGGQPREEGLQCPQGQAE